MLYDVLNDYCLKYPEVKLNIELEDILGNVADENFDLALHFGRIRGCSYVCRKIRSLNIFVVATPEYWRETWQA